MRLETIAVHAGRDVDPASRAVAPPITRSVTFQRDADGRYPRGHVLVPDDVFHGTIRILREILQKWQISFSSVAMTDANAVRAAIRENTRSFG